MTEADLALLAGDNLPRSHLPRSTGTPYGVPATIFLGHTAALPLRIPHPPTSPLPRPCAALTGPRLCPCPAVLQHCWRLCPCLRCC